MRKVWVVVANGSVARVFRAENATTLVEVRNVEHPESRLLNQELVSDRPGRATEVRGGNPHQMQRGQSPKLREKDYFAEEVARILEEGSQHGDYEQFYLIANDQFASLLHHHLTPHVQSLLSQEIHKDLTEKKPEEIRTYLPLVL